MKILAIIVILLTASVEAGWPKWFPATRGQLLDQAEKSAEMDKNLAEYDQNFLKMASGIPELSPYLRVLEYMANNNLEMTESNLKIAIENTRQAEQSGDFIGSIVKSVTTGDPMAMLAVITTGAGLLGFGSSRTQKKKADNFRAKALRYAHMNTEDSKKALKEDQDFPDIIA